MPSEIASLSDELDSDIEEEFQRSQYEKMSKFLQHLLEYSMEKKFGKSY